jgi:CheY-like chemotaxis protein
MKSSKIVMIIDDNQHDRFFFKTSIKELAPGIDCIEARNGEMAIVVLQNSSRLPDFIFLDSNMPGMNGLECLKRIKQDSRLSHIPIIMFSGAFTNKQTIDNRNSGAAYSLIKSADLDYLPEEILQAIDIVRANAIYQ